MQLFAIAGNPQTFQFIQQALLNEGKEIKLGELLTRIISNSGIQEWDKIIVEKNPQDIINDANMKFQVALSQAHGMNGIPPQPQGQPPMEQQMNYGQPSPETQQPF
jgi:protein-disulfide isomerase-like protein with CxxC motif